MALLTRSVWNEVWTQLFVKNRHLDSTLAKVPKEHRSHVASILHPFLRMPATTSLRAGFKFRFDDHLNFEKIWPFLEKASQSFGDFSRLKGTKYDFPEYMVEEWKKDWGNEAAEYFILAFSNASKIGLRLSTKVKKDRFIDQIHPEIKKLTLDLPFCPPQSVLLSEYITVKEDSYIRSSFERGEIEFQDLGSQWLSILSLWPNEFKNILQKTPLDLIDLPDLPKELPRAPVLNFIDACAGAGGKSLAVADYLRGQGRVYAYDVVPMKLQALKRRASKIPLTNIQAVLIEENNESQSLKKHWGKGDIVLVDAPCSGWGTLRKSPDMKWKRHEPEKLEALQLRLLHEFSKLVSKKGRLVYSTCTFRKAETCQTVSKFLETNPDFETNVAGFIGPSPDGSMDAFYIHVMEKRS